MPERRNPRLLTAGLLSAGLALAGALLLAGGPALSAQASLGSLPVVVDDYVASGQLQARLSQVYGPGATKGSGVDFDATTKPGPIARVYAWTDDRYAHADSAHPIQLTNYWTVPITIAGAPVGVAAVWINPTSDQPELAEFTKSASLATALAGVPGDAALVHDGATAAWYGVANGTATPLVAGRSGVTKPTPVADLVLARATPAPQPGVVGSTGIGLAVGVLALLVLVILATVLLPRYLKPKPKARTAAVTAALAVRAGATPAPDPATAQRPVPDPAPAPGPAPAPKPRVEPKPRATAPALPRAAPSRPRTPVTQKPAASKPSGTKPTGARSAATKPAVSKPPSSKPRIPPKPPTPPGPAQDEDPEA